MPSQWEQSTKCGLSESLSLFDQTMVTKSQARKDQLTFMTEFARFMNYKAPELLQVRNFAHESIKIIIYETSIAAYIDHDIIYLY